jgi:hypothetical protein
MFSHMHKLDYRYTRAGVVVVGGGVVVRLTDGRAVQVTLRSESVPLDEKVMKPGWSLVIWLLIQVLYWETLEYTPGKFSRAQPMPKLTTPDWIQRVPCLLTSGPPESPYS